MNTHKQFNKLTQEYDIVSYIKLGNFCVRPRTRVKPHPPLQDKFQVKKGWDYTRVSTVNKLN